MSSRLVIRCVSTLSLLLLVSACASRGHIRGCDIRHPYHQAESPADMVMADGLKSPRTRATFHVPAQKHLAPKAPDLATAEDLETLSKDELLAKRCIVAPPRLFVPEPAAAEQPEDATADALKAEPAA